MISFDEYVLMVADMLERPEFCDDVDSIRHRLLADIGLDSLEVVMVGSVTLDLLPPGCELPQDIMDSILDTTLGDLYHFIAAAQERTDDRNGPQV
jgi:hypothetical protein